MKTIPLRRVVNVLALGLAGVLALDYFSAIPIGASASFFPATLEGELRTVVVDYGGDRLLTKADELIYLSSGRDAPWVRLDFSMTPDETRPEPWQARIRATGWFLDDRLEVDQLSVIDVRGAAMTPHQPIHGSARRLLAVRVLVSDRPFPVSVDALEADLFAADSTRPSSVYAYYRNASHGVVAGFHGEVVTVETEVGACSLEDLETVIDPLVRAQGVDPATFDHVLYAQPNACPFVLLSEVHGRRSIQDDPARPELTLHAIGHNLGARHAAREHQGEVWEFGDLGDVMGNGRAAPHAPTLLDLGWLYGTHVARIDATGSFSVQALAVPPDSARLPRALALGDPATGDRYLVSYRSGAQAAEAEALLPVWQDRVFVHRVGMSNPTLVAVLAEGEAYVVESRALHVAFTSRADDAATVDVALLPLSAGD